MSNSLFRISIYFFERGAWSPQAYTYLSDAPVQLLVDVVVPTGSYFSVGRVVACEPVLSEDQTMFRGQPLRKVHAVLVDTNPDLVAKPEQQVAASNINDFEDDDIPF